MMPVFLEPGYRVTIKDRRNRILDKATILDLRPPEILQISPGRFDLNLEDRIELEISLEGKGLYVFQAIVRKTETDAGEGCVLQLCGEPRFLQRRQSHREPVYQQVEYILLPAQIVTPDFHKGLLLNISRGGALLASKEPLILGNELFLIFEINLYALFGDKAVPTGIGGTIVREHSSLEESSGEWEYSFGVAFDKPFAALSN